MLAEDDFQFPFVGRQEVTSGAASSFKRIVKSAKSCSHDPVNSQFAVCAGMHGVGKTLVLEEGTTILRDGMKLNPTNITTDIISVIVLYSNEYNPPPPPASRALDADFGIFSMAAIVSGQ
ncbi:hypothetical protein GN244_ATG01678 [Phytophthora infestans]|uniref:Uncharacterized protein n=1 Tax=Phytophthora infestans TaxID=4787 RepID=A0A833TDK8_PHYIN|nr:hypothetical protein GN244_ATG01678 [Phytophthora infestans]